MTALVAPDPPLDDGVVRLRLLRPGDAAAYAAAFRDDPDLASLIGGTAVDEAGALKLATEDNPKNMAAGKAIELAVADAADDRFLGSPILYVNRDHRRGELGFWLVPDARGTGAGRRMLTLLAGWAFGPLGLERLWLETYPSNLATRRLAEAVGFVEEGTLREHAVEHGRRESLVVYGLLAREWPVNGNERD